jgi:hypothetical protein
MLCTNAFEDGSSQSESCCVVELYGVARMLAGTRQVVLDLAAPVPLHAVVAALAERCPALCGPVLDVRLGRVAEGYVLNRNGRDFLAATDLQVRPGDRLLLLSSAAGG